MRHFNYLSFDEMQTIFLEPPSSFPIHSDKELLSYSLGATLYMPATRQQITADILSGKHEGLVSLVICLEDAIGDDELVSAEISLIAQMKQLANHLKTENLHPDLLPLIFVRVREPAQMARVIDSLEEDIYVIKGFVFPKFTSDNGAHYFNTLQSYKHFLPNPLYGMPILETRDIVYRETRIDSLIGIKSILDTYRSLVLNVRMGATDFSSLFGLRRGPDVTIYAIATIRDCIADIINVFGRIDNNYVVSGPVWEYFSNRDRVLKPQLRQTPFQDHFGTQGVEMRQQLINHYVDGLIREILLDKENGIIGKTIIHPSHIKPVQSLLVVSHEEYMDARSILENNNGQLGVMKSDYSNKMNEIKPHLNWARKIMLRGRIYGVFREQHNFIDLLAGHVYG